MGMTMSSPQDLMAAAAAAAAASTFTSVPPDPDHAPKRVVFRPPPASQRCSHRIAAAALKHRNGGGNNKSARAGTGAGKRKADSGGAMDQRKKAKRQDDAGSDSDAEESAEAAADADAASSAAVADFEALLHESLPDDPYAKKVTLSGGVKTVFPDLQPGMLLYHPARLVVKSSTVKDGVPAVTVQSLESYGPGREYEYRGTDIISRNCFNCDQYSEVKQATMTGLARLIKEQVGDSLCKVEFTKEPVPADMAKLLEEGAQLIEKLFHDPVDKEKQFKRLYERSQRGEYRIMRGYILRDVDMTAQETETGMVKFLDADLMAAGQYAQRQINLKHVQAVVLNGVRHERKKA